MHIVLNAPRAGSEYLGRAREVLRRASIDPVAIWIAPYTSDAMWKKRREVQQCRVDAAAWVVNADVDEFHEYPEALDAFLGVCEQWRVDCIQSVFVDRLSADGRLKRVCDRPSLWRQFPRIAEVQCAIGQPGQHQSPGGSVKLMAHRGWVLPNRGGHRPLADGPAVRFLFGRDLNQFKRLAEPRFRFSLPLRVHHFKWTAGLETTLRRRLATPGVSPAGVEYGRKVLDHIEAHGGIAIRCMPSATEGAVYSQRWRWRVRYLWVRGLSGRVRRWPRRTLKRLIPGNRMQ